MFTSLRQFLAARVRDDALLSSPDFRRYWASSALNGFGGLVGGLAMSLCAVVVLKATPAQMGILTACQAIPFAVLALPAGVWLDRRRKLPVLQASKLVQSLALASIALAYGLGLLGMGWLYAVAIVTGCCAVAGGGAEQIFLVNLVGRDRLVEAQARFVSTDSILRLVAPGVAGLLVQWLSAPVTMLVNAAGVAASYLNMRKTRAREPEPAPSNTHPLRDIHEGLRFMWQQPLLRMLAFSAGAWQMLFYGFAALAVLYQTRDLGITPGELGIVQVLGGLGVLASSFLLPRINRRHGPGKAVLAGTVATTFGFVATPLLGADAVPDHHMRLAAMACISFVFDCGVMMFLVPYLALRQTVTPDALMGRMISTMRFLTVSVAPVGAMLAGAAADMLGVRLALAGIGAGGLLLTACMLASRQLHSVRP